VTERADRKLRGQLVALGLLREDDPRIKAIQDADKLSFPDAVAKSGLVPRLDLLRYLGEAYDVPHVDLDTTMGDPLILEVLPREKAYRVEAIPLFLIEKQLTVAVADPDDLHKLDELRAMTNKEILPVVTLASDIRRHLPGYYGEPRTGAEAEAIEAIQFEDVAAEEESQRRDLAVDGAEAARPVVRLVNLILVRAIEDKASDIHIEQHESQVVIRYRVDGRLQVKPYAVPLTALPGIVSRIKVLASMDISERRVPQDGKIRIRHAGRPIDLRVSTFPTIGEEKVVLRILDRSGMDVDLTKVGMSPGILAAWRRIIRVRQGIILVTGPTGSGKSTTLFGTLRHLRTPDVNIITLEDPVEYELPGITQSQVNERAGFTFARGLRAILRQDPDIILVGEIRDPETAQIAVQAALTGHLVLASLHTNDAPSAVTRLLDIGLASYLLAAALAGVLAQRLVRRLCAECGQEAEPTDEERDFLGPWLIRPDLPFVEGMGCARCLSTGYKGRVPVHEVLELTPQLRALLSRGASADELGTAARAEGYRSLWADGLDKVRERATTLRELARVVDRDPSV
jgi:type IV pilus assembly protein PilB